MSSAVARILRGAGRRARAPFRTARHRRIYAKYAAFTMVGRRHFAENLRLSSLVRTIPGCVVECGVWRGGMIAGIAEILGPTRSYLLFDSFEGLPPAREADGEAAITWQRQAASLRVDPELAARAMRMSGARDVRIVPGWFADTLPGFPLPGPIALLRLDGDWFESTRTCLEHLAPRMAPGGLIIVDDYFTWDGCARAVHRFLSDHDLPIRIRQSPGGICHLLVDPTTNAKG